MSTLRLALRLLPLALVLGIVSLVVPDSAPHRTDFTLVKVNQASGVDPGSTHDDGVIWVLAVGSDARPGEDMNRVRGDALQLIGMNTKTGAAAIIGVPRDSWVSIDGYGSERINAALYYGGPQLLGQTVGDLIGVQPDYVIVTRFKFFQALVEGIGGVDVDNPIAFDDPYLKDDGFDAGRIHLGGYDAMAFSRIRHNLLRGDFDRSANQQRVVRGIQAKVHARAAEPGFLAQNVLSVMQYTSTDLSPAELFRLATAVSQIDPGQITNCVVQGDIGNVGGASVVLPYTDQAARFGNDARDDATLTSCD